MTRDASEWVEGLEALGARVSCLPSIGCEWIEDPAVALALKQSLATAAVAVFPSLRSVEAYQRLLGAAARSSLEKTAIAVVGPRSRRAAEETLGRAELLSADGTAMGLLPAILSKQLAAKEANEGRGSVVFIASEQGRHDLQSAVEAAGVRAYRYAVYRTLPAAVGAERRDLLAEGVDGVLFASPSAVRGLANQVLERGMKTHEIELFSIGPTTSREIEAQGWRVTQEAEERSIEGLAEAIGRSTKPRQEKRQSG